MGSFVRIMRFMVTKEIPHVCLRVNVLCSSGEKKRKTRQVNKLSRGKEREALLVFASFDFAPGVEEIHWKTICILL